MAHPPTVSRAGLNLLFSPPKLSENPEVKAAEEQAKHQAWMAQEAHIAESIATRVAGLQKTQGEAEKETDPIKKQELVVQCREEHRALTVMAKNLTSVEKKLDVVIDFIGDMQVRPCGHAIDLGTHIHAPHYLV